MSINVVIVAVLALIVLIVLVLIFTGKTKLFSSTTTSCASKGAGAHCISNTTTCDGPVHPFGTDCAQGNSATPWCCVPVGGG